MRIRPPTPAGVAVGVVLAVVLGGGVAVAQGLVTSADIKDGTITAADIKNGTITSAEVKTGVITSDDLKSGTVNSGDIKDGSVSSADIKNGTITNADIKDGTITSADLSAAAVDSLTAYQGPHWSIVDRNVIGAADAYLRAGPSVGDNVRPPLGVGSLGVRTATSADAAAFGNQVDFGGTLVEDLTALGFSVFTTAENISFAPNNLPNLQFEIDPNLDGVTSNFSTMSYLPDAVAPGVWVDVDAVNSGMWGLTGDAGPATGCDLQGTLCTFADLLAALDDGDGDPATILSVMMSKGRDHPFSGAVDALIINDQTFDFEPNGVVTTSP
jgi:hypothetical protein